MSIGRAGRSSRCGNARSNRIRAAAWNRTAARWWQPVSGSIDSRCCHHATRCRISAAIDLLYS